MSASHTPDNDNLGGEVLPFDATRRRPAVPEAAALDPTAEGERVIEGRVVQRPPLSTYPLTVIRVIATPANAKHVRRHGGYVATGAAVMYRHWDAGG